MDLRQLEYFVASAEAGSLSRAASRCGVSQPSISQGVSRLEEELGVTLFDRLGRGVVLTEAGAALLGRARAALAAVREMESAAQRDLGGGELTIGAIPTMAPYLLPPLIRELRRERPDGGVVVREDVTQRLVEAVCDHELDLAITSTPIEHEQIEVTVVGEESFVVAVPDSSQIGLEGEGRDAGGAVTLPELRAAPLLTLHEAHCMGEQVMEFCRAKRLTGSVAGGMSQIRTLVELVRLGQGIAIVPEMAARLERTRGVRFVPFARTAPRREIAVIRRRGRSPSSLGRLAVRLLTDGTAAWRGSRR
ncbi:MAG: LysR family transcriptional regulator [Planctomycetota bacterium]